MKVEDFFRQYREAAMANVLREMETSCCSPNTSPSMDSIQRAMDQYRAATALIDDLHHRLLRDTAQPIRFVIEKPPFQPEYFIGIDYEIRMPSMSVILDPDPGDVLSLWDPLSRPLAMPERPPVEIDGPVWDGDDIDEREP